MGRLKVIILLAGVFFGSLSLGCEFLSRIKPNYTAIVTKLNFYNSDGTLFSSQDCHSGQLKLDFSSSQFTLREFKAHCDSSDVIVHATAMSIVFDRVGAHYYDLKGHAIPVKAQCSEEELQFQHIHQGTWVDGFWTSGDNTWKFKWVGKSLLFHWVHEYPGGKMETIAQFK